MQKRVLIGLVIVLVFICGCATGSLIQREGLVVGWFQTGNTTSPAPQSEKTAAPGPITQLNQTYEKDGVKITATELQYVQKPYGSADEFVVAVKFVIENTSAKSIHFYHINISTYVDDVAVQTTYLSGYSSITAGDIAPGKRAEGYYCAETKKGAQKVELQMERAFLFSDTKIEVTFLFNIPFDISAVSS